MQREDLSGLISSFGTEDWQPLKDALGARSPKRVVRSLTDIRNGPAGDAAIRTCVILATTVTQWLHAAALVELGVERDEASTRMRVNPYVFERSILPVTRRWDKRSLIHLLRGITEVESGVRRGHAEPWVELESTLVLACRATGSQG